MESAHVPYHTELSLRGDVTSDGVHLNAKGYEAVIQRLTDSGGLIAEEEQKKPWL